MTLALQDRTDAGDWLAAGICLSRLSAPSAAAHDRSLSWIQATYAEHGNLPPVGMVMDVGAVLGGRMGLDLSQAVAPPDGALRSALRRYENQLLASLVSDAHLPAARDAFARLDAPHRALAVALVVSSILERLNHHPRVVPDPGRMRRLGKESPDALVARGFAVWRERADVLGEIARDYDGLAAAARSCAGLLTDADVFHLENIDVLGRLAQRVFVSQVVEAAEELTRAWPRRVRGKSRTGAVIAPLEEESQYPAGGFSSITNSGSLENLVTSELIYMDRGADFDLFDVRYAEGELLYYTRDEGMMVRPRRHVVFVLHPSLDHARVKDPELPWQRIVILLGLLLAFTGRLTVWLGEMELRLSFVFWRERGRAAVLRDEVQLLNLVLREWRDKNMAEVSEGHAASIVDKVHETETRARTDVVFLGDDVSFAEWAEMFRSSNVRSHHIEPGLRSWNGWVQAGLEVLRELV